MKNKKGFTLVELLAVIVVLGILMTVAGVAAIKIKKDNNKKQAQILENSLTKLGDSIYSYETTLGSKNEDAFTEVYKHNDKFVITLKELKEAGYLKDLIFNKYTGTYQLNNPAGGTCDGYLEVTKENDAPVFKGYIDCGNLYNTDPEHEKPGIEAKLSN